MKTIIKFILVLMFVVIFAARPAISSATNYTFSFFDYPGATDIRPTGINSSGKIVGDYDNWSHGFTYEAGIAAPLNVFGSLWSFAYGINTQGHITGVYRGIDGFNYSYLYYDGSVTSFGISGNNTHAGGINDYDQIVGHINDGTTGFFYDNGTETFEFFVYPGDTIQTRPSGINNNGIINGLYLDNTGWHGFIKKGDVFTSVDYPGALNTYIIGINNYEVMIGSYDTVPNGERYGFIYKDGIFTPFKIPGYTNINARGITDDGRIVGRAKDANGNSHGFLATPANITPIVNFLLGD
jgi:probable HAF family extracellular repeat protein